MNALDARDWFLDAATRLKDIDLFFHNIDAFKEKHRELKADQYIMVLDEPRGNLAGQINDNIRDNQRYGLWILGWVENKNWEAEDQVYDQAKKIALKVIAKAYYERKNYLGLFKGVNIDSTDYYKAGPELKNWFGCFVQFNVSNNVNDELVYVSSDWN